jgi:hypothetical protein
MLDESAIHEESIKTTLILSIWHIDIKVSAAGLNKVSSVAFRLLYHMEMLFSL